MPLLLIHDEFLNVVKGRNQLAQQTASCAIRFIAANLPCSDHLSACKPGPSVTGEVQTKIKRVTNPISLHRYPCVRSWRVVVTRQALKAQSTYVSMNTFFSR